MQVVGGTVVLPQFLFDEKIVPFPEVVDIPVVAQMWLPMVLQTIEIPQLHVDMVIDVPGAVAAGSTGAHDLRQFWTRLLTCPVVQRQCS